MPLVVLTFAEERSKSADADDQAAHLLRIADHVYEALGGHFLPEKYEIWDAYPRAWLGGNIVVPSTEGRLRPRDFRVPLHSPAGDRVPSNPRVHGNNCIVLKGDFSVRGLPTVPAHFEINLTTRYAHGRNGVGGVGDVVFETQKTVEAPWDGLYQLLANNLQASASFLQHLENSLFLINRQITSGPRVRWASLKSLEGAAEPVSDAFFLYRRDDQRIPAFIRGKLLELALEQGAPIYNEMDLRSIGVYRSEVTALVDHLMYSHAYERAVSSLGEQEGLISRSGGSVMFYSTDPEAATKIADRILRAIGPTFWDELRRRLGAAANFDPELDRLAQGHR
jgi:hypothetical protein